MSPELAKVVGWIAAILATLALAFYHWVIWYDLCKSKLWMDNHLSVEGQPVPVRKGFWWRLFLFCYRRFP